MSASSSLASIVKGNNFVILDTETTGLSFPSQPVSIGIVDHTGAVLVDTLINPKGSIPPAASRVHGIYDYMVVNAPAWPLVRQSVWDALHDMDLIIYNAQYDLMVLESADVVNKVDSPAPYLYSSVSCAMEWYAPIAGQYNDYHQSFTWQKLTSAMRQQGLPVVNAHGAVGDCLMTLSLLRKLIN